jgi:Tetratricopeptide repeat
MNDDTPPPAPPPGPTTTQAERLWLLAHDHVRRGEFAQAVRQLAQCYAMLQALGDPRLYEVHRRWTEVHKMYLEEGARPTKVAVVATSTQAQAEAAANAGELDKAIRLYDEARVAQPNNELIVERLAELRSAQQQAQDLLRTRAVQTMPLSRDLLAGALPRPLIADDGPSRTKTIAQGTSTEDLQRDHVVTHDIHTAPTWTPRDSAPIAPVMDPEDAPLNMGSLDVSIDLVEATDVVEVNADDNDSSVPVVVGVPQDDVMWLQSMLVQVAARRRPLSSLAA